MKLLLFCQQHQSHELLQRNQNYFNFFSFDFLLFGFFSFFNLFPIIDQFNFIFFLMLSRVYDGRQREASARKAIFIFRFAIFFISLEHNRGQVSHQNVSFSPLLSFIFKTLRSYKRKLSVFIVVKVTSSAGNDEEDVLRRHRNCKLLNFSRSSRKKSQKKIQ